MELLNELTQIVKETTCTLFSLCINPEGKWKMYIYQSKMILIGSFENVNSKAIAEFKSNRELLSEKFKNHRCYKGKKYRYNGTPKKLKESDLFARKLKYAKTLGFSNISVAYSTIGKAEFEQQFKHQTLCLNNSQRLPKPIQQKTSCSS
jgi:hypothetical protein